ncbi:MAG TPA: hypothetical protein VFQ43_00355 [Nitrososphaera sp.]|nr:hypothetical protein [Nitrososphaera sp.]
MTEIILTVALIIAFLPSGAMFGQNAPTHKSAKAAPQIGAAFSKAAIKALFTIGRNANKQLIDAAMVDLDAAGSTDAENSLGMQIETFASMYEAQERALNAEREAGGNPGANEGHACIGAWVPKLRALSSEIPKECKSFMGQQD